MIVFLFCRISANVTPPLLHRVIATTRNKQQQRFCEFIKPFLDLIFDLHLKVVDFEQLKIIGRGAFGQVALVKVLIHDVSRGEASFSHLIITMQIPIAGEREWEHLRDENAEQDRNVEKGRGLSPKGFPFFVT